MKVAILTFQNSNNYGALLQAYALQYIIERKGFVCEILNYHSPHKDYSVFKLDKYSIRNNLIGLYLIPSKLKRKRDADKFRNKYLNITSKKYISSGEIRKDVLSWDIYIAGSDQIWNYENTGFDKTYFLDFVHQNKTSYAASFGVSSLPVSIQKEYASLLSDFQKISVREKEGKTIINQLLHKNVEEVLDPTLLLDKQDWELLIGKEKIEEEYIVIYSLFSSEKMYERIHKFAKANNIKVKVINGNGRKIKKYHFEIVRPDFLEFVKLYRDAKLVITDSFHGTIFSINFNTNFYSYDAGANNFSRISNVLNKLNLQSRILNEKSTLDAFNPIDFSEVNDKIVYEKEKSFQFLNGLLNLESRKNDEYTGI